MAGAGAAPSRHAGVRPGAVVAGGPAGDTPDVHRHRTCLVGLAGAGAAADIPAVPDPRRRLSAHSAFLPQGDHMTSLAMNLLERDLVPDFLIRLRIRSLLASRLREEDQRDP